MVCTNSVCHFTTAKLHADLTRFWEMEEHPSASSLTEDELRCEKHFVANHVRLPSGQYMIRLPFRDARLKTKPAIKSEYFAFLSEYKELNHMELANDFEETDSSQTVYLPHHPIIQESSSTTDLRVVFNASSLTSNGSSLNSHLHIGPKLLTDLVSIILHWRMPQFVFVADVEKMFRQIKVDPRDCDYQRILWHSSEEQLARDEGSYFPKAQAILENNLYVDDVLYGADTTEEANELREQVANLMRRGGFHLRK
ncbi:uncharacterized protein LOC117175553 [Belonocnema kinseyi]|uniref:uncharacterized protein LOC117175553 n=1 Tax=Belonocnema kinseyi TaxID=2817044 RepID=UPI00143DF7B3|nr:uncharacterized protein LOC117175553 [Belonocnema kinseyi]